MVSLNSESILLCGGKNHLINKLEVNQWQLRNVLMRMFFNYRILTYHSFEALVLSVFPYEDKRELFRFWNGYHPSEYIISKISDLTSVMPSVNLKPFQVDVDLLKKQN